MSLSLTVAILIFLLLLLLLSGLRVAFALGIVGAIGLMFLLPGGESKIRMIGNLAYSAIDSFTLTPVPLFVLMGELLVLAKMNESLYGTLAKWMGNFRGGLCHATTLSCAVFAAMSGSSLATAATLGTIASPEMIKRGYSRRLTYGTLAAGGTLGILIPPSITMIIYGNLAGVSIGHCFIAGVVPGIICALSFVVLVDIWGRIYPNSLPTIVPSKVSMREHLKAAMGLIPSMSIIFIVLGGIYLGVTTPTEAAAVGAFAALILCIIQRDLTFKKLIGVLLSTVRTTSFIMLIVASASVVSFVMQYLRVPELLTKAVIQMEVSPYIVLSLFYLLYFILGMLIDPVSMMVMTIPTILPTVELLGFDPIWFAVVITIMCEVGLITPPVGLNLYILRGVSDTSLGEISLGAMPFVLVFLIDLAIFTAFPILSLWLPNLMR